MLFYTLRTCTLAWLIVATLAPWTVKAGTKTKIRAMARRIIEELETESTHPELIDGFVRDSPAILLGPNVKITLRNEKEINQEFPEFKKKVTRSYMHYRIWDTKAVKMDKELRFVWLKELTEQAIREYLDNLKNEKDSHSWLADFKRTTDFTDVCGGQDKLWKEKRLLEFEEELFTIFCEKRDMEFRNVLFSIADGAMDGPMFESRAIDLYDIYCEHSFLEFMKKTEEFLSPEFPLKTELGHWVKKRAYEYLYHSRNAAGNERERTIIKEFFSFQGTYKSGTNREVTYVEKERRKYYELQNLKYDQCWEEICYAANSKSEFEQKILKAYNDEIAKDGKDGFLAKYNEIAFGEGKFLKQSEVDRLSRSNVDGRA